MYRHLTVALDGSHNARPALIEAVRLAAAAKARLSLVHVISVHDFAIDSVGLLDVQALQEEARKQGQFILDEGREYAQQHGVGDVSAHLLEAPQGGADAATVLVDFAAGAASDLLILGTHGHRGWKHLLLGSFAEAVLRRTTLPLLVVRNPEDDDNPSAGTAA
ncbi:universal stress protein [Vogesella sp. LIG4]|uniref:universal stress protein n=1 Tax=Vogesella sp. LIG4 TaxID=1192162 RepID=UPI00081FA758|nr:universal stress protein [Vogesella sp. LIG4]SCK10758.1 Nucleotide-binding universal stress protein, UspA family [Vogesella sp. LIG4]